MHDSATLCSSLTAKLAGHHLPVIRQTSAKVIALLSSKNTDIETIAAAIRQDQAFMARILSVANSAYYRRRGEKITTIARAIMQIGYATTRDIAIAAEYVEATHRRVGASVDLRRLLAKAFVAAHQATALGQAGRLPDPDVLFTNTLLESLGEVALASHLPLVTQEIEQKAGVEGLSYEEAHLRVTGLTPHEVTVFIATAYRLPQDLILPVPDWDAVSDWTPADRRYAIVHLANGCARNLFAVESPLILEDFNRFLAQAGAAVGVPAPKIAEALTDAFHKALEFGASINLGRDCFTLDSSAASSSTENIARQALLETCADSIDAPAPRPV
jgi:HD-like signal output (HDOD) protein